MAMSATISLSPTTVQVNQQVNATLTVSNSGGSAVNVTSVVPTALFTGAPTYEDGQAVGVGQVNIGPGSNVSVSAGGSLVIPFSLNFFAPSTGLLSAGSGTFSVGAVINSSDGSIFSPTAATVTVNNITFAASQQ